MVYSNWREYQEATAAVFRRLGCDAVVEFQAQGVRAKHDIDVYVSFLRQSIKCTWIIECKLWKNRVPKEKVLALKSIVDDLGADRGIIFSEAGFQPGAQDAARGTNITLVTSLKDFEQTALAASTEVPLAFDTSEVGASIYKFPSPVGPHDLLVYRDQLVTANWTGGTISIVNPATKSIVKTIDLDNYQAAEPATGTLEIRKHPPGSLTAADGRLFVGQVFSDFILVIDLDTHAIVKRIFIPGGGEGQLTASADERTIYFASNRLNQFYVIDAATYEFTTVAYPAGGCGCMSLLKHPSKELLYIGVQRGGMRDGRCYPGGNCFLAAYDLALGDYIALPCLAEVIGEHSDDASPACISFDELSEKLYVGMFQSMRGICVIDTGTHQWVRDIHIVRNKENSVFPWADPLSQAVTDNAILSVNRNNCELGIIDKASLETQRVIFLGRAPNGPRSIVVWNRQAIVSYPGRNGLIFVRLDE